MKKFLSLLAVCSFGAVASSSVVACTQKPAEENIIEGFNEVESKIIKDVVSENKTDYKFINKNLTYEDFFNKNDGHPNYIMDKLYSEYKNKLNEIKMAEDEKETSRNKFFDWSQKNINLVYLNKDKEVKVTYQGDEKNLATKKLEDIYLNAHDKFYPADKEFSDTLALRIGNLDNWTFTFGEKELSWDLNAYNNKSNGQPNKIWISKETVKPLLEKEDKIGLFSFIKAQLWQGMFDADDKPDKEGNIDHSRQIKRFEDQNIDKALQLGVEKTDELISELKENLKNEKDDKFTFKGLNLKLTKDVFSKTTDAKTGGVKDYILKKSEATIEKIEINLIK